MGSANKIGLQFTSFPLWEAGGNEHYSPKQLTISDTQASGFRSWKKGCVNVWFSDSVQKADLDKLTWFKLVLVILDILHTYIRTFSKLNWLFDFHGLLEISVIYTWIVFSSLFQNPCFKQQQKLKKHGSGEALWLHFILSILRGEIF